MSDTLTENEATTQAETAFVSSFSQKLATQTPEAAPAIAPEPPDEPQLDDSAEEAAPIEDQAETPSEALADEAAPLEPEPDEDDAFEAAFTDALAREGVDVSLEGLPADAKAIVAKRLKEIQAGFTKATQRTSARFADYDTVKAERDHYMGSTYDITAAACAKDPGLWSALQAAVQAMTQSPREQQLAEWELSQAKAERETSIRTARESADKDEAREVRVTKDARAACQAAGIPYTRGVEALVAEARRQNADLTRSDIQGLVREEAKAVKAVARRQARDASSAAVKAKVVNAQSGLRVKPGTGAAPGPGTAPKPKNDKDFLARFSDAPIR